MTTDQPDANTPVGTPVHVDFRKYDGREHWQEHYFLLGVDEIGTWLGMRAGTPFARPGVDVTARTDTVRLLPHQALWAACYNAPDPTGQLRSRTYVDITTPVSWTRTNEGFRATLADIDLDVIELFTGEVFIDDEDEFEAHTVALSYPPELVDATRRTADEVFAAVCDHRPPFDGTGAAWLERINDLPG